LFVQEKLSDKRQFPQISSSQLNKQLEIYQKQVLPNMQVQGTSCYYAIVSDIATSALDPD